MKPATIRSAFDAARHTPVSVRKQGPWLHQIQLHLDYRLNVWGHPTLPLPAPIPTAPHTHDFTFTSRILLGTMVNNVVTPEDDPEGAYGVHEIQYESTTPFTTLNRRVHVYPEKQRRYGAGEVYTLAPSVCHYTEIDEPTITLIHLHDEPPSPYYVYLPLGKAPNASNTPHFLNAPDADQVWQNVDQMLRRIGI